MRHVTRWQKSLQFGLLWMLLISLSTGVFAQTPFLAGTASKSTVGQGEQFQITFTFNAAGRSFQGPDLKDFNVLSGPNQSTNMQFINGNFSQSISFSYYLQPKTTGAFKIGPASIEYEGKRIASNVIQLTVVKGQAPAQQGGKGQAQENVLNNSNIFVRAVLSKSGVLKGESVLLTFKLYSNVNVLDFAIPRMPSFDGFWNQDIQLPQTLERSSEVVDGSRYTVWEIKKLVLFPQQSGTLTIDPMEIECVARVKVNNQRSRDPFSIFDDPFFGMGGVKDVKYAFKSEPVKIKVYDLPGNAPADFSGAVGQLNFEAKLDKSQTKANEAINLKIKISGNGNLKLADIPEIEFPQDLESYDPKVNENFKASVSGVNGSKTFEYLLIPRHEGEYEIPAISFSYFDLSKKQYVTKKAGPFAVKVGKGTGAMASVNAGPAEKSEFRLLGNDIRYIKVGTPEFDTRLNTFYGSPLFYALSISPVLLFAGLAFRVRQQSKMAENTGLLRSRNATSVAQKRLALAKKHLGSHQPQLVFEETHKALMGYLGDKFSIPLSEMSREKAGETLREKRLSDDLVHQFFKNIDDCEMARYGGLATGLNAASIYENAVNVITEIESSIKS
ncbi:MAG: protein BatD [Bacteroidia bacterium]|nr:protein BatD [Bacteroidia bacterium]